MAQFKTSSKQVVQKNSQCFVGSQCFVIKWKTVHLAISFFGKKGHGLLIHCCGLKRRRFLMRTMRLCFQDFLCSLYRSNLIIKVRLCHQFTQFDRWQSVVLQFDYLNILYKKYQRCTLVDIGLAVGTFALLVASTSADLDESPCFIPSVEPLVVNNWTLEPFEFQPSYFPSFYNMTGVTVRATKYYQSWRGRYYVDGMFLFKVLKFSSEYARLLSNSQFWCYCRHVKNCLLTNWAPGNVK